MLKDGEGPFHRRFSRKADHNAFQELAVYTLGNCPKQPMPKAPARESAGSVFSPEVVDDRDRPIVLDRYQMTHRPGGAMRKRDTCRGMDQTRPISRNSSRVYTAQFSLPPYTPQYPAITCGDGNGDVKPDHPSGPGTYGHAV